jgi:transcriptional antiterminator RfaH
MSVPTLEANQRWYAAFTQPNGEQRSIMHLRNQGFAIYLPRFLKKRRSGRRTSYVAVPLFPRYLFVGIDLKHQRWRSVNGTIGICHLVSQGEWPVAVDERILHTIAAREGDDGLVRLAPPRFREGEAIRVTDGVFADQLGLYEGIADQDRVRILLDLLGRKVRVLIEAEAVAQA